MSRLTWPGDAVELDYPNPARVHDALLGGAFNFAADRRLARALTTAVAGIELDARAERYFLHRAVRLCVDVGIRQFLDLGSGTPTVGNACHVAQHAAPDTRVLCVDIDPVVVELTRYLWRDNDRVGVLQADLRWPDHVLDHHDLTALLNLDEPVAVLLVSVLHLVPDEDDPWAVVARLGDRLAPGSHLVISHTTSDCPGGDVPVRRELIRRAGLPETVRTSHQIRRLFTGFDLVEPGLVHAPRWRPDRDDEGGAEQRHRSRVLAGVAVKPAPSSVLGDGGGGLAH